MAHESQRNVFKTTTPDSCPGRWTDLLCPEGAWRPLVCKHSYESDTQKGLGSTLAHPSLCPGVTEGSTYLGVSGTSVTDVQSQTGWKGVSATLRAGAWAWHVQAAHSLVTWSWFVTDHSGIIQLCMREVVARAALTNPRASLRPSLQAKLSLPLSHIA